MAPHTVLWTPDANGEFDVAELERSTHYRALVRHLGRAKLEQLARDLTEAHRRKRPTRWNMLVRGNDAVDDLVGTYHDVIGECVGDAEKIAFRIIPANVVPGHARSRVAAVLSPLRPQVWVRLEVMP